MGKRQSRTQSTRQSQENGAQQAERTGTKGSEFVGSLTEFLVQLRKAAQQTQDSAALLKSLAARFKVSQLAFLSNTSIKDVEKIQKHFKVTVGPPHPTKKYSVADQLRDGIVGLYGSPELIKC